MFSFPYFIAELGINHHGSFDKAMRMIDKAKVAGAHAVKTQFYDVDAVLGKEHPDNAYAKTCQLTKLSHERLAKYANSLQMDFSVSVFNNNDIPWAASISSFMKVASRMNQDTDFIEQCIYTKRPVIMSIQNYIDCWPLYRMKYMWCVRQYPSTEAECLDFNFDGTHGLSSHCPIWETTVKAYDRGASVFENHVCESELETGCDIPASLTFQDYTKAINAINAKTSNLAR